MMSQNKVTEKTEEQEQLQDWESGAYKPTTEKEKKQLHRARVEQSLEGNPNIPKLKKRVLKFKPPTEAQQKKMKFLDSYGNPLPGFKWDGYNVVPDPDYKKIDPNEGVSSLNGFHIVNAKNLY